MFNKTKHKNKKRFCRYCLQCFSSERILVEYKKVYLKINGKQVVKSKRCTIKFRNNSKQLATPLRIYADFECIVKGANSSNTNNNTSYTEKNQGHTSCRYSYKIVCIDDNLCTLVVLYRGKKCSS